MADKKKVRELMVLLAEYPRVYEHETLKDAIKTLKDYIAKGKEHRSLLVFSNIRKIGGEEELVGILTVRDILKALEKNIAIRTNRELPAMSWAYFYRKDPASDLVFTTVGQVVRPLVKAFIQADKEVTKAIEIMMTKGVNIIPVFEGKKAVGIIRGLDLLDYIGDLI